MLGWLALGVYPSCDVVSIRIPYGGCFIGSINLAPYCFTDKLTHSRATFRILPDILTHLNGHTTKCAETRCH